MSMLLNKAKTRKFIFQRLEAERPGHDFTAIAAAVINELNACVKVKINDAIKRHPSRGKTFSHLPPCVPSR